MKGYIDAVDLASYVAKKYKYKFNSDISSIKLQKSLYFLFAYWGGFVRKAKLAAGEGQIEELNEDYKEYLFDNKIEAWIYGPVVVDVYHKFDRINLANDYDLAQKIRALPNEVLAFIDDLLDDLFTVSDFKLVDISHSDDCWKKNFKEDDIKHNREIHKEDIINEYSTKG